MSLFDDDPLPDPDEPSQRIPIGRDHPSTSHEMAAATGVPYASERGAVLAYVGVRSRGVTCAECADALGIVRNQAAISFLWLRDHGWVERVKAERYGPLGADEKVDADGLVTRRTGPRTRGVVQRLREDARMDFERWEAARQRDR